MSKLATNVAIRGINNKMPVLANAMRNSRITPVLCPTTTLKANLAFVSACVKILSFLVNSACICCKPLSTNINELTLTNVSSNFLFSVPNNAVAPCNTLNPAVNVVATLIVWSNPLVSEPA